MGRNQLKPQPKLKLKRTLIIVAITGGGLGAIAYLIFGVLGFSLWPDDGYAAPLITVPGDYVVPSPSPIGPGGVGNSSTNTFRYQANSLLNTYSDGDGITNWQNEGGNPKNCLQNSSAKRPILHTSNSAIMNGQTYLSFDGSNDFLYIQNNSDINTGGPWTNRTLTMVFRTGPDVTTRQFLFEEGGGVRGLNFYIYDGELYFGAWNKAQTNWGYFFETAPVSPNSEYIITMAFAGTTNESGTVDCFVNEELIGTMTNVGKLYAHSGNIRLGCSGNSFIETGSIGSGHYFEGDIAEFIIYDYTLNTSERILVHNHLSSKYDIPLHSNDLFLQDSPTTGEHDFDVAGIGRMNNNDLHNDARGDGILRFLEIDDLDNNEFLIWGHDGGTTNINNTTDVPSVLNARMQRVWRVCEKNFNGGSANVGKMDIIVDLNNLYNTNPTELQLIIDMDDDMSFADETPIAGLLTNTANAYVFQHIQQLSDGKRFTFGVGTGTFLPIELGDFSAALNAEVVEIEWNTLSQSNNDYFTLEHSTDGELYSEIGEIDGAGSSSAEQFYSFTHNNPIPGINYYRLKQTDFDGEFEIFDPVSVEFNKEVQSLTIESIAPNPFNEEFRVNYVVTYESTATITLVNLNGLEVYRESVDPLEGYNTFNYTDGYDLEPGMYILTITQGTEQRASMKIVKK